MNPAFTVIIPARMASSRLPNKPLADLAGVPMVVRVAQQAQQSGAQQVVVAADDERIVQACQAWDVQAVMTQTHHLSGTDRIAEACQTLKLQDDDLVVNVQGDEPLIDPQHIQDVASLLAHHDECVMSTLAHPIESTSDLINPNIVKLVLNRQGHALYFSRAPIPWWREASSTLNPSVAPGLVFRHVGLYGYRVGFLKAYAQWPATPLEQLEALEQLRVLENGHHIAVHISQQASGVGVDTPEDLARVQARFALTSSG